MQRPYTIPSTLIFHCSFVSPLPHGVLAHPSLVQFVSISCPLASKFSHGCTVLTTTLRSPFHSLSCLQMLSRNPNVIHGHSNFGPILISRNPREIDNKSEIHLAVSVLTRSYFRSCQALGENGSPGFSPTDATSHHPKNHDHVVLRPPFLPPRRS